MARKNVFIASVVVLLVVAIGLSASGIFSRSPASKAQNVIESLEIADWKGSVRDFNPAKCIVSSEMMAKGWPGAVAKYGRLMDHQVVREEGKDGVNGVYVACKFERGTLWAVARFDNDRQRRIRMFGMFESLEEAEAARD